VRFHARGDSTVLVIGQALAVPAGNDNGINYLWAFIEDVKASRLVPHLIEQHHISVAAVSAPAVQ